MSTLREEIEEIIFKYVKHLRTVDNRPQYCNPKECNYMSDAILSAIKDRLPKKVEAEKDYDFYMLGFTDGRKQVIDEMRGVIDGN